jgi:hypothetical protein
MLNLYQRSVVGFHGCDRSVVEDVVLGRAGLRPSNNRYDWLGSGIYFWEHGPNRAMEFAQWKAERGEIEEPAVLGAVIHLGRCFDLADTWATAQLRLLSVHMFDELTGAGNPLPINRPGPPGDFDLVRRDRDWALRTSRPSAGSSSREAPRSRERASRPRATSSSPFATLIASRTSSSRRAGYDRGGRAA